MIIYLIFIFIFGLIIGSFLNCLIWRLHTEESMWSRSYCPKCKKQIVWYDNIPIFSYIFLLGKCRHCSKKISWQYPVVEFVTGILFVIAFLVNVESLDYLKLVRDLLIIFVMIIIFVYDLRWYMILDIVTIPAIIIFFIINIILDFSWLGMLLAGFVGGGFFLAQFIVSKGKWIGGGDIRLGLLMGVALGRLDLLILALMVAYFSGSIIGVGLILAGKRKWSSEVPFGVFLSVATLIALFWGDFILNWYFGLI
jgi:prepilin signal peptidase PulO-like enzyme (type II secretory pathway)